MRWLLFLILVATPLLAQETGTIARYERRIDELKVRVDRLQAIKSPTEAKSTELAGVLRILERAESKLTEHKRRLDAIYDRTIGVSDICPVHKIAMVPTIVPIEYGPACPAQIPFPFAQKYVFAGCFDFGWKTGKVYVCEKCVEAEATRK